MDSNALNSKFDNLGFSNHLNAINMTEKTDSWCVQLTNENKDLLKKHLDNYNTTLSVNFFGAVYGIDKKGKVNHSFIEDYKNDFDILITTEEFYQKIGLIKEIQYEIC